MTLLEIMIALVILGAFFIPVISSFTELRRRTVDSKNLVTATNLASSRLELLKALPFHPSGDPRLGLPLNLFPRTEIVILGGVPFTIREAIETFPPSPPPTPLPQPTRGRLFRVRVTWKIPGSQVEHALEFPGLAISPAP